MKRFIPAVLLLSAYFILSCSSCAMNIIEADAWLASKADATSPVINITGKLQDAEYDYSKSGPQYWFLQVSGGSLGWGLGEFRQKGNDVTGVLGNYVIKGVVNGEQVYLVMFYGGEVYYTAKLEVIGEKELFGCYYYPEDKKQSAPYPMKLIRAN